MYCRHRPTRGSNPYVYEHQLTGSSNSHTLQTLTYRKLQLPLLSSWAPTHCTHTYVPPWWCCLPNWWGILFSSQFKVYFSCKIWPSICCKKLFYPIFTVYSIPCFYAKLSLAHIHFTIVYLKLYVYILPLPLLYSNHFSLKPLITLLSIYISEKMNIHTYIHIFIFLFYFPSSYIFLPHSALICLLYSLGYIFHSQMIYSLIYIYIYIG